MKTGSKESTNGILKLILSPHTRDDRLKILVRNLIQRSAALAKQCGRIEGEMAKMEAQRQRSMKRATQRKVNKRMVNRAIRKKAKMDL